MPTYKLYYFDCRAKAEVVRLLFLYGDLEYEDIRYSDEEWPNIKDTMPFKQVPMLEVDGRKLIQSRAMYRLIAKRVGLYSNDDLDAADIDAVMDTSQELWNIYPQIYDEEDPEKKAAAIKNISEERLPPYLQFFEKMLEKTNGYLVGGRMTVADLCCIIDLYWALSIDCTVNFDDYPRLKSLAETISKHPKFAAQIAKYPLSGY